MKTIIFVSTVIFIIFSCPAVFPQDKNYLLLERIDDDSEKCGYVDSDGNVVIPFGNYPLCLTDTLKTFAIVYCNTKGFIAIDRNDSTLFQIYTIDNGPDYPSEGLFRIVENGKIGFADEAGVIKIKPKFSAALPFHNGLAAFCDGCVTVKDGEYSSWQKGKWGFINTKGDTVIPETFNNIKNDFRLGYAEVEYNGTIIIIDSTGKEIPAYEINQQYEGDISISKGKLITMNYQEWMKLFSRAVRLIEKLLPEEKIMIKQKWLSLEEISWQGKNDSTSLQLDIIIKDKNEDQSSGSRDKYLVKYVVYPWQNFFKTIDLDSVMTSSDFDKIFTVTGYAVIYTSETAGDISSDGNLLLELFNKFFKKMVDYDINQEIVEDSILNYPEGLAVISTKVYRNYLKLDIAVTGSTLPHRWDNISNTKMVHVRLIPDIGPTKEMWVKPIDSSEVLPDPLTEIKLLNLFASAIEESLHEPKKREQIFYNAVDQLRNVFKVENYFDDSSFNKYRNMLKNWLLIPAANLINQESENLFPGYEPKSTPDTAIDFMPAISENVEKIPSAEIENLEMLVRLFNHYTKVAEKNPGGWTEGNIILGAKPKAYIPSPEELLAAIAGERLQKVINSESIEIIKNIMAEKNLSLEKTEYLRFTFIHYDVLGSGRFFYVDTIERVAVTGGLEK